MYFDVLRFSEGEIVVITKKDTMFEILSQPKWVEMIENGEASQYFRVLVNE